MVVQNQSELGEDETVYKELVNSLVRAATTASSLEAEQDSGNITKTRSKATPNESSSLGTTSGGGPRSRTHKLKRLYKVGLTARVESSGDEEDLDDADNEMFDVNVLNGEEVFVVGQNENVVKEVVDDAQLQAEFDEEEILAREKAEKEKEADIALIEEWNDIQAKIDADH
ncbi:hypothetical protein Tco_0313548 [Tanacetum coccineum]